MMGSRMSADMLTPRPGASGLAADRQQPVRRSRRMLAILVAASIAIVLPMALLQISAGSYAMTWGQAWAALSDAQVWAQPQLLLYLMLGDDLCRTLGVAEPSAIPTQTLIVWNIRLPRVLVAIFVGINLSFSGSIFQSITRNEMASPYLLGVSSGAGLAILLVLIVYPAMGIYLPVIAMAGGAGAFLIVYSIAWKNGASPVRLILAGIIVAAIAGSLQTALFFLAKDLQVVQNALEWTTGSLTGVGWAHVRMIVPWSLMAIVLAFCGVRYLDLMMLGDPAASALGVPVERARFFLAVVAILAAASSIAVAGMVGFVGLIVPHIVRSLAGSPHKRMLFGCLFAGPALLLSADTASRLLFNPVQLPVGIVTGALGGTFFLYLMRRKREFGRL